MPLLDELERPTLLISPEIARQNIAFMAEKARRQGIRFRPHFKTHQSAVVGEWFRAVGVGAITVSSVEMALYFADNGWDDIIIAFPVNIRQMSAINALARRIRLGMLVESVDSVEYLQSKLQAPVDIWLKIDSGSRRTGLPWDQYAAVASLAHTVTQSQNTRLRGLLTHAGETYGASSQAEICERYQTSVARMTALRADLWEKGHGLLQVSVGDTPGCTLCPDLGKVDEIRPGNFVFYDGQMLNLGVCSSNQIAAVLACPVVALHPERGEVVVYGGAIHLSKDVVVEKGKPHYGYIVRPKADGAWSQPLGESRVVRLSQEHGILSLPSSEIGSMRVGDWLGVIPAHICLTVAALGEYFTLAGNRVTTYRSAAPV